MKAALNWRDGLAQAAQLGLSPHQFWQLSLIEWRAITRPAGPAPLNRAGLEALRKRHPDTRND